jgi:hypothetical protein
MSEDYPVPPPQLVQQWWEEADQHVDCDDPETWFDTDLLNRLPNEDD